ncbi:hypothetical protein [Nocardioides sp. SLBN-35]|jgi:hypothetical protein|uniref:hypothetical protein n=1 Tax=Nocardioides sp. SLBN-35 TaxID=2768445 RepID=UPI001154781A|nr:hypothetical protein [Nocardioides sp. SLBN-35]TQK72444.1 hypothetical protein FBY23_4257 [Nocardioides sp. SLBN-35]
MEESTRHHEAGGSTELAAVWLEKYVVHLQEKPGETPTAVDHMLLCESVLNAVEDRYEVTLSRGTDGTGEAITTFAPGPPLVYVNEMLLNRKMASFGSLEELDRAFPPGPYTFVATDAVGTHALTVDLGGSTGRSEIPAVPTIDLLQDGVRVAGQVDPGKPLRIEWDPFVSSDSATGSETVWFAQNAIFLLIDNCRGEMVYSSGVVPPVAALTQESTGITLPAGTFEPGLDFTVFLSFISFRDTASAVRSDGSSLEGASVNSIAVELPFTTGGEAAPGRARPPRPVRANYRWPGPHPANDVPIPWPVDDSGLHIAELPLGFVAEQVLAGVHR